MKLTILTRQISHYHDARYRGVAAKMDDIQVLSTTNEGAFSDFVVNENFGYDVVNLYENRAQYDAALQNRMLRKKLEAELTRRSPDVIAVAGWSSPESLFGIGWARKHGIPIVVFSESQQDDAERKWFSEAIKKRVVSYCDAALVGGASHSEYIQSLGMPADRIECGYNAVDNEYFTSHAKIAKESAAQKREEMGLPRKYLLASGRFIPKKNFLSLIKAYAALLKVRKSIPDLIILGDGEQRSEIEATIHALDVSKKVSLPGFKTYEHLPVYYGLSDGFIHVSTTEQWGLVINEAMASGVPVMVSARCGAARALVQNEDSGIVVEPSQSALETGLSKLIGLTDAQRHKMGQRGAEVIAKWGPDRFGEGLKRASETATNKRKRIAVSPVDRFIFERLAAKSIERVA